MDTRLSVLQDVKIASPCPASWEHMKGDERVRFCERCSLHVYNIAELTAEQAERLIMETEGRLCGRIYRRWDGTVLTRDCPVALQAVRRKLAGWVGRFAAVVVFAGCLFGLFRVAMGDEANNYGLGRLEPFATLQRWLDPNGPVGPAIAGEICIRPGPAKTPTNSQP